MRNVFLCSMILLVMLMAGISAGAADSIVIPTAEEFLQAIPTEVQQQAKAGSDSIHMQFIDCNGFSLRLGQNDGTNYIVNLLFERDGTYTSRYGIFDFAASEWRIPCDYQEIMVLPNQRYWLLQQQGEKRVYYETLADGTINPDPLPIDGQVIGVDEEGYVTLYRNVDVAVSNPAYAGQEKGSYAQMALLDNQYQMVLDYIAEDDWAGQISFLNGTAIIRSGSTRQEYAGHQQISFIGSVYGMINRKGEWVGRHDYSKMYRIPNTANARIFAEREDASYWITEEGIEIPLLLKPSELEAHCSSWARVAIEQAKSRGLVPEKIDGYYTLDIFREEFCSLLMHVYRALGKEMPALNSAPTFSDCDLEDVRMIAALKVVSGYEDGSFRPRSRITREEAAAILSRFISLFRELDETVATPYRDDSEIGGWAKPQVYAVQNAEIMSGTSDGAFSPKNTCTIEQAISVINRLYDLLIAK